MAPYPKLYWHHISNHYDTISQAIMAPYPKPLWHHIPSHYGTIFQAIMAPCHKQILHHIPSQCCVITKPSIVQGLREKTNFVSSLTYPQRWVRAILQMTGTKISLSFKMFNNHEISIYNYWLVSHWIWCDIHRQMTYWPRR
jgi:hypothetical protein